MAFVQACLSRLGIMAGGCKDRDLGTGSSLSSWMLCRPAKGFPVPPTLKKHLDFLVENYSSPLGASLVGLFDQEGLPVPTLARVGTRP